MSSTTETMVADFLTPHLQGNLLRYAIQSSRDFCCPLCGVILDCDAAVMVGTDAAGTVVVCAGCYERTVRGPASRTEGIEIVDGRIVCAGWKPNRVDNLTGCHLHKVPKVHCKLCIAKRDYFDRVVAESQTRRDEKMEGGQS